MAELLELLTSANNAYILAATWALIEMMTPIAEAVVMHPRVVARRLTLHRLQKLGKRVAAVLWCSLAVWIPQAQPKLCTSEGGGECQTVFQRVAVGIILGALLSGSHWAGAKAMRRALGRSKRHKIACANCNKRYVTEEWSDPCPKCGQTPHEVTQR